MAGLFMPVVWRAEYLVDFLHKGHKWTPTFAKLSIDDFEKVKIAAIQPDFW
jgi:hypothetical protein